MTADFKRGANLAGKVLASGMASRFGDNTLYTVPANTAAKVATAVLCNTSGSPVTISVNVVPNGGTAGVGNQVISAYGLAGNDSVSVREVAGALLDAGASISVNVSASGVIACTITGAESS